MTEYTPNLTLADDLLVRYLDEHITDRDREPVDRLANGSPDAVRLWELGEASDHFAALLADVPVPETPTLRGASSRAPRRALKAAAIALLAVAGTAAAMPSVRSAVARGLDAVSEWVGGAAVGTPVAATAPVTVTFPITASEFTVEIENTQGAGSLSIERSSTSRIAAEAGPAAELIVLPERLFVRNSADSRADVTIWMPRSVTTVHVVIAGVETEVRVSDEVPAVRVPLRTRSRTPGSR